MTTPNMTLSTDSDERKEYPIYDGCIRYFPAALALVANTAKKGNDKHNKGQPLHHARGKSGDHGNCIVRHMMDIADLEAAYERQQSYSADEHQYALDNYKELLLTEAGQLAWRALAFVQELCERYDGAPLAPAARLPETGQVPAGSIVKVSPAVLEMLKKGGATGPITLQRGQERSPYIDDVVGRDRPLETGD